MIAAVSPSVLSYEDTYNTLKYANRAKSIKASLSANTANIDIHISQYGKIVEDLKAQIEDLKLKIKNQEDTTNYDFKSSKDSEEMYNVLHGYENDLQLLFRERCTIKQNLVDSEGSGKELSLKLLQKERGFKRLEHISELAGSVPQHAEEKLNKFKSSYELKQAHFLKQKVLFTKSFDENLTKLNKLKEEIDDWVTNKADSFIPTYLKVLYGMKELELKYVSVKAQCKYMRKQLPLHEADNRANEQLISHLLKIIASQQRKLNIQMTSHSPVDDINEDIQDLPKSVIEGTKIAWADQTFTVDGCSNIVQFEASPFKTPSRKPNVLRQMVLESRNMSESRNTSDQTVRNTVLNAKSLQVNTPMQLQFDRSDSNSSTEVHNSCTPDCMNETSTNQYIPVQTSLKKHIPLHTSINMTPICSMQGNTSENPIENQQNTTVTKNIPTRARTPPLLNKSNVGIENIPNKVRKKSHRRSFSDGHQIPQRAESRTKVRRIISPKKILYPGNKVSLTNNNKRLRFLPSRAVNSRPPCRAPSISQKENIHPEGKYEDTTSNKSMNMYRCKSTLPMYSKRGLSDQRTFRL